MPLPDDVAHLFDLAGIFPLNYREFAPVGAVPDEHFATEASPFEPEAVAPADGKAIVETVN